MSLKAFHLIFLASSIMLAVGFAGWCFREYRADGAWSNLAMGIGSVIAAGVLAAYSRWFLRKLKHVSYI